MNRGRGRSHQGGRGHEVRFELLRKHLLQRRDVFLQEFLTHPALGGQYRQSRVIINLIELALALRVLAQDRNGLLTITASIFSAFDDTVK